MLDINEANLRWAYRMGVITFPQYLECLITNSPPAVWKVKS